MEKGFEKSFDIVFSGLKLGKHTYDYQINKELFDFFGYSDLEDANLQVVTKLNKQNTFLEFFFDIKGQIKVHCDISNELFDMDFDTNWKWLVKFGEEFNDDNEEILVIPFNEFKLNIAKPIFDLIVLNLPTKRIHPDILSGESDSEMIELLEKYAPREVKEEESEIDSPFKDLKKLLK